MGLTSLCDGSNPNKKLAETAMGHSPPAPFRYSHMMGGIPDGQAQYLRVPYADIGTIKVPDHLTDEQVLSLSDVFPTGYMGAENPQVQEDDTVAIWGCGPVGLVPEPLAIACDCGVAEIINTSLKTGQTHVHRYLKPLLK